MQEPQIISLILNKTMKGHLLNKMIGLELLMRVACLIQNKKFSLTLPILVIIDKTQDLVWICLKTVQITRDLTRLRTSKNYCLKSQLTSRRNYFSTIKWLEILKIRRRLSLSSLNKILLKSKNKKIKKLKKFKSKVLKSLSLKLLQQLLKWHGKWVILIQVDKSRAHPAKKKRIKTRNRTSH